MMPSSLPRFDNPSFNAPHTVVVTPLECQSKPRTQPNAWNQCGSESRSRKTERPCSSTMTSAIAGASSDIRSKSQRGALPVWRGRVALPVRWGIPESYRRDAEKTLDGMLPLGYICVCNLEVTFLPNRQVFGALNGVEHTRRYRRSNVPPARHRRRSRGHRLSWHTVHHPPRFRQRSQLRAERENRYVGGQCNRAAPTPRDRRRAPQPKKDPGAHQ